MISPHNGEGKQQDFEKNMSCLTYLVIRWGSSMYRSVKGVEMKSCLSSYRKR